MSAGPHQEQIGGAAYHVADAYVRSVIHYLDSPTDYCEYLPTPGRASPVLLLALGLMVLIVVAALALVSHTLLV